MKNFFLVLILFIFFSTNLFAEYRLEPVQCTLRKQANCGAYLYNSKTGATYYCNSEKCTEVMPAFEEEYADEKTSTESKKEKKSKIPKKIKKKEKKSKIPKFKKKKSD